MAENGQKADDRPKWAEAIAPAADPRRFPATDVKRDHSAAYDGKYAPKRGR